MPKVCEKRLAALRQRGVRVRLSHAGGMRPWSWVHGSRDPVVLARQASLHHRL